MPTKPSTFYLDWRQPTLVEVYTKRTFYVHVAVNEDTGDLYCAKVAEMATGNTATVHFLNVDHRTLGCVREVRQQLADTSRSDHPWTLNLDDQEVLHLATEVIGVAALHLDFEGR